MSRPTASVWGNHRCLVRVPKEINGAAHTKHSQGNRSGRKFEQPSARAIVAVDAARSLSIHFCSAASLSQTVLMQSRLNGRAQSATIVHGKRNKAKRLLGGGQRAEHFRRAQHRPRVGQEHHLHLRALINRPGQGKQSTGDGKHLEFAGSALTILKSKHRGSEVCEVDSRCAQLSVQLGEAVHIPCQYGTHLRGAGDYERSCPDSISQIRTCGLLS